MQEKEPQEKGGGKQGARRWLKRIGVAGFLFFLIKGLAWIAVLYGGLQFLGCKN
jgi:hypothetical protein